MLYGIMPTLEAVNEISLGRLSTYEYRPRAVEIIKEFNQVHGTAVEPKSQACMEMGANMTVVVCPT